MRRLFAGAIVVMTVALGVPAVAVQTATFGLAATGQRTKLIHPPGSGDVHDSVEVYNRTRKPITIDLDVIAETAKPDGTYTAGASGAGFAAHVDLETRVVELGPLERRTVGVTIDRPDHTGEAQYAAITAVVRDPDGGQGIGVTERLAVLVGVTAGDARSDGLLGTRNRRLTVVAIAAALVVGLAAAWVRRRRQVA